MMLNNTVFCHNHLSRLGFSLGIAMSTAVLLSGCQSTIKPATQPAKTSTSTVQQPLVAGKSSLGCFGIYHCEINSIGKTAVIHQATHQPNSSLAQQRAITVLPVAKSASQAHSNLPNYLVTFPSGQQLINTRFYLDDGLNTVESFSFLHQFDSGKRYQLRSYRQIQKTDYSLLAQSAPTPLCLDLLENDKLINRWCKKPNQQGALSNEFIKVDFSSSP